MADLAAPSRNAARAAIYTASHHAGSEPQQCPYAQGLLDVAWTADDSLAVATQMLTMHFHDLEHELAFRVQQFTFLFPAHMFTILLSFVLPLVTSPCEGPIDPQLATRHPARLTCAFAFAIRSCGKSAIWISRHSWGSTLSCSY